MIYEHAPSPTKRARLQVFGSKRSKRYRRDVGGFHREPNCVATGGSDGVVKLWDARQLKAG